MSQDFVMQSERGGSWPRESKHPYLIEALDNNRGPSTRNEPAARRHSSLRGCDFFAAVFGRNRVIRKA